MRSPTTLDVTPLRRRYAPRVISALVCLASLSVITSLPWLTFAAFAAALIVTGAGTLHAGKALRARLDGDGVWSDDQQVVDRRTLRAGRLVPGSGISRDIVLELIGRPGSPSHLFRLTHAAEVRTFLEALRLDEIHLVPWIPFRGVSGSGLLASGAWLSFVGWFVTPYTLHRIAPGLFSSSSSSTAFSLVFAASFFLLIGLWITLMRSSRVHLEVGEEGVTTTTFGRTRFVAFGDLVELEPWTVASRRRRALPVRGFDLVLRDGKRVHLGSPALSEGRAFTAIERAWKRYRAGRVATPGGIEARLERDGRDASEWARRLATLADGGDEGFRELAITRDHLEALVASPSASAEARAGAAYALTAASGAADDARQRVRIAAQTVASPDLRATLEALAELEDEEEREAALVRLTSRSGRS